MNFLILLLLKVKKEHEKEHCPNEVNDALTNQSKIPIADLNVNALSSKCLTKWLPPTVPMTTSA